MNHMNYVNRGNENNGTAGLVNQIRLFLQDPLFLALCILYSIHTGLSLISGDLPLLSILMTIFLWLFYSQGRNGLVAPNYIRCISGTVLRSGSCGRASYHGMPVPEYRTAAGYAVL